MRVNVQNFLIFVCSFVIGVILYGAILSLNSVPQVDPRVDHRADIHVNRYRHGELYKKYLRSKVLSFSKQGFWEDVFLYNDVKVLCYVIWSGETESLNLLQSLWGFTCNRLLIFIPKGRIVTSGKRTQIVTLSDSVQSNTWHSTLEALHYIYEHHLSHSWFLHVKDDSFVIMENLRYYLSIYNASEPFYFGHAYKTWQGFVYNTLDAGYVLSKSALTRLYKSNTRGLCSVTYFSAADVDIGRCLRKLGILPEDTRDSQGRARFLVYQPDVHLIPGRLNWISMHRKNTVYQSKEGPECCSDHAVTFNSVPQNFRYVMHYMLYHLKPYGDHRWDAIHNITSNYPT